MSDNFRPNICKTRGNNETDFNWLNWTQHPLIPPLADLTSNLAKLATETLPPISNQALIESGRYPSGSRCKHKRPDFELRHHRTMGWISVGSFCHTALLEVFDSSVKLYPMMFR